MNETQMTLVPALRKRNPLAKRTRARGAATVELAICLPVLLLISTNMLELCSMMFVKQSLTVAAYETAHRALQPGAAVSDAVAIGQEMLVQRRVVGATISITPSDLDKIQEGEFFTVRVRASASNNRLLPFSIFQNSDLSATAVAMKETPAS